jgi:predicted transcriptional regulator
MSPPGPPAFDKLKPPSPDQLTMTQYFPKRGEMSEDDVDNVDQDESVSLNIQIIQYFMLVIFLYLHNILMFISFITALNSFQTY